MNSHNEQPSFFLGADFQLGALAAGYGAILGGLLLHLSLYRPAANHLMLGLLIVMLLGAVMVYRASCVHFLTISHALYSGQPADDERCYLLTWTLRLRKISVAAMGGTIALINSFIMLLVNGQDVFSLESLAILSVVAIGYHVICWRSVRRSITQ